MIQGQDSKNRIVPCVFDSEKSANPNNYEFDFAGREIGFENETGEWRDTEYDADGNIERYSDSDGVQFSK